MAVDKILRIYSEHGMRKRAKAGRHNFLNIVGDVARSAGFEVEHRPANGSELLDAPTRDGYALTHMKPPPNERSLVFRRVYDYPFWYIDRQSERWEWDVAKATFDPETIDPVKAEGFAAYWRKRLFGPVQPRDDGFAYVPLQGQLQDQRAFQSCSPIEMIRRTRAEWPETPIVVSLHPREKYRFSERVALERLAEELGGIEIQTGGMEDLLPKCRCVVTMNSAVAFWGFFLQKPAILFARIDFHHIATDARNPDAFRTVLDSCPDYVRYLFWFWQMQSINAGRPDAHVRIAQRLREFGWPV